MASGWEFKCGRSGQHGEACYYALLTQNTVLSSTARLNKSESNQTKKQELIIKGKTNYTGTLLMITCSAAFRNTDKNEESCQVWSRETTIVRVTCVSTNTLKSQITCEMDVFTSGLMFIRA